MPSFLAFFKKKVHLLPKESVNCFMEKNCGRRESINQIGCMWVFISIFGSNQKRFLMDMKHGSKRLADPGDDEKMQLTCSSESSQDVSIAGDEHVRRD